MGDSISDFLQDRRQLYFLLLHPVLAVDWCHRQRLPHLTYLHPNQCRVHPHLLLHR